MGAKVAKRPVKRRADESAVYLEHVRSRGCCMAWCGGCAGDVIAHHHGKSDGGGGTSRKPSDFRTVPLCDRHHRDFHQASSVPILTPDGVIIDVIKGNELEAHFAQAMVRCLESWILRDAPASKVMARARVLKEEPEF